MLGILAWKLPKFCFFHETIIFAQNLKYDVVVTFQIPPKLSATTEIFCLFYELTLWVYSPIKEVS
jgi:hypothetical protein